MYTAREGFIFNTKFRFGYSDGNSKYLSVDGTFRLDYNWKKYHAFIVSNYEYKETEASKVVNKGFIHLRGVRPVNDRLQMEGFLQQEFNEFLNLRDRKLIGGNARILWVDKKSQNDSLTVLTSHLGLGLMYEREIYSVPDEESLTITMDPVRINSYLTLDLDITRRINIWAVGYFQPNVQSLSDFRAIVETGLEIWVIGRLYFTFDVSYRYNNRPVGDVYHYDLVLKNGLRYSIP